MGDYNPFANRDLKYPTSYIETLLHLIKAVCGSGILSMPMAFMSIGLLMGSIGLIVIAMVNTHGMSILVRCSHILGRRHQVPSMTIGEIAKYTFLDGPPWLQRWSQFCYILFETFILIPQLGCVIIYLIVMATSTKQLMEHQLKETYSVTFCIILCTVPLMIMCLVRNLKFITPISLLANIVMFSSFAISLAFIMEDLPSISERRAIAPFETWPIFVGTALFAISGIGCIMALENNMREPENLLGFTGVLNLGMFICTVPTFVLGFFGYLKYGEDIKGNFMLNLPIDNQVAQGLKLAIALTIFFTSAVQFYVAVNIVWTAIGGKFPESLKTIAEYILRILLIIFCSFIAIALPNVGPMTSLIGAFSFAGLGIIFPSIVELIVYRDNPGYGRLNWRIFKNIFLIIFGFVGMFTGAYVSILEFTKEKPVGD